MLERQLITMPFAQGVDTKTDEKQVAAGKLLELENGVFTTLRAIRKRNGSVALGKSVTNTSGQVTSGSALATYGSELLIGNGASLFSYDEGADGWTRKGDFVSAQVSVSSVVRDTNSQTHQDGGIAPNGIQLYAWQDSSGASVVRYAVIDSETRQTVVASTLLSNDAAKPRVVVAGAAFCVYFVEVSTGLLRMAKFLSTAPSNAPTLYTLTGVGSTDNALSSGKHYDAALIPASGVCVAFDNANGGTTIRLYKLIDPSSQAVSQQVIAYSSREIAVFHAVVSVNPVSVGPVVAFTSNYSSAWHLRYAAFNNLLVPISGGELSSNAQLIYAKILTGCAASSTDIGFEVYWSVTPPGQFTARIAVDSLWTPTEQSPWKWSVTPFARAFSYGGAVYIPVQHESKLQTTYFVLASTGAVIAKALYGTAGQFPSLGSKPMPSSVTQLDDNTFTIPCLQQAQIAGAGFTTQTGVSRITIDFNDPVTSFGHAELSGALHFTGGFVQMYDGVDIVEHNFHLFPENVSTYVLTSGGNITGGTYSYSVCYEWVDNQNNIHRSYPSPAVEAIMPDGITTGSVRLTIPYLNLTSKTGSRPVQIVIYRTQANKSELYRVTSLTAPTLNNTNAYTVEIYDTDSDASIAENAALYSQFLLGPATGEAQVLPNIAAPPASLIQLHRNRLWVTDSTNPLHLWYSKEVEIGGPVEFTQGFVKQIDPRGGFITALATVDDKLLVFTRSHIFTIVGRGPDANGLNNDLSDSILVTTDVGCVDPRSTVGTPIGIMFQSAKGIYLIDRSLQVSYVGAPVEAYNSETITSATLMATVNQVRFTLKSGKTLVYDYLVQQWGVFTGQYAVDSLIWLGSSVVLRANGTVLKEMPNVWTDAGAPYSLKLTTSWLTFANVQGYQRVRRAQILGAWRAPHNLVVDVCVDFNDVIVQSMTVTPQTPTVYGGTPTQALPYGNGIYGGTFQLYQWRIDLAQQKNQAVKFTIRDLPTATAGEGMSLSAIAFEVGAKQGAAKVPATQIFS